MVFLGQKLLNLVIKKEYNYKNIQIIKMKTIIVKTRGDQHELNTFIQKLAKYADRNIKDAVVCTRLLSADNYNTIVGEVKDAVALDDFDLFIIGVVNESMQDLTSIQTLNKAHTLICNVGEMDSAKNYVIML